MKKILQWVLVAIAAGATLAFGGVQPSVYSLTALAMFGAVLALLLKQTLEGKIHLHLPLWMTLFVGWVILQLIPLPVSVVAWLSPVRAATNGLEVLGNSRPDFLTLSIYPHYTDLALIKILMYLSGFVLGAYLFDSREKENFLFRGLVLVGCFEAVYGIIQYLTGWQKIFRYTKVYDLQEATGTYINRNHFAGLMELILPLAFALAFYSFQVWLGSRGRGDPAVREQRVTAAFQTVFYVFLTVLMSVGLVFSRSRMGIATAILSVLFIAVMAQVKVRRVIWALVILVFMTGVVGYGLLIGLDPVLTRFESVGKQDFVQAEQREGRLSLMDDGSHLIREYPVTGTGLGTFAVALRRYQTRQVGAFIDHAHNDYIEFAADTGLVGVSLLFLPIFYLLVKMMISFLGDPSRHRRAVTLGCIGAVLALLTHALTDFNFQIPANALIFAIILGIGYKAACVERRGERMRLKSSAGEVPPVSVAAGNSRNKEGELIQ